MEFEYDEILRSVGVCRLEGGGIPNPSALALEKEGNPVVLDMIDPAMEDVR